MGPLFVYIKQFLKKIIGGWFERNNFCTNFDADVAFFRARNFRHI